MREASLVEQIEQQLRNVPWIHCRKCADSCAHDKPDYPALAEKVAGWIEPIEKALNTIAYEPIGPSDSTAKDILSHVGFIAVDALAALPWRKAVTP